MINWLNSFFQGGQYINKNSSNFTKPKMTNKEAEAMLALSMENQDLKQKEESWKRRHDEMVQKLTKETKKSQKEYADLYQTYTNAAQKWEDEKLSLERIIRDQQEEIMTLQRQKTQSDDLDGFHEFYQNLPSIKTLNEIGENEKQLRKEIEELKSDNHGLAKKLETEIKKRQHLEQMMDEREEEIRLQYERHYIKEYEEGLKTWNKKINDLEKENHILQKHIQELGNNLKRTSDEYEEQLQSKRKKIDLLRSQIIDLQDFMKQKPDDDNIKNLEQQIVKKNQRIEILESENRKLRKASKDVKIDMINPQTKKPFKSLKDIKRSFDNLMNMYNNNVKLLKAMQDFNNE